LPERTALSEILPEFTAPLLRLNHAIDPDDIFPETTLLFTIFSVVTDPEAS